LLWQARRRGIGGAGLIQTTAAQSAGQSQFQATCLNNRCCVVNQTQSKRILKMDVTFEMINGLSFGLEYCGKDEDIDESAVILHFACFRAILWLADFDK
jgi:hypothetical protein